MKFPLILIIVLCFTTVAVGVSWSKSGCPDKCGNVIIPYPFGIGSACSANYSYTVICENSSIPILSSINMEALDFSLDTRMVKVKQPLFPVVCSPKVKKRQSLGKSLLGSPFTISATDNLLVVSGCQNIVWLNLEETTLIGGCIPNCVANFTGASCNGAKCCHIQIPQSLQEVEFTYQSIVELNNNGSNFCGYVFLEDQKWFQEDYEIRKEKSLLRHNMLNPFSEDFRFATVVLKWKLNEFDLSPHARSTWCYEDRINRHELMSPTTKICTCQYGYEGNPYLPEGCQDIDECRNACPGIPCINLDGSFICDYTHDHNRTRKKIALIIISSGLGTILFLIGTWKSSNILWKRFKAYRKRKFFKRNGGLLLEKHELSSTEKGVQKIKLFSSKELSKATDHYNENRVLGHGGQGTVYKGMLTDGRIVAVKKSKKIDEEDIEVFINEVVILSQINHRNVVRLMGCCLETEIPLLIYEFIPNGTLFQHIHEPNEEFPLTWDMRVRIATEVANSLSYLHSAASAPIYHRDIKSTNILLDDKYRAKISDFGTSRSISIDQTHLTTRVLGTFGYLDPEYFQSSQFTDKSDVYSFGVVMVELLTGEKAVSSMRAEVGRSLATHFLHSMDENQLFEILDARVLKEGPREEIVAIAELAQRCLDLNGRRRPTMKEVAMELEGIQMSKEKDAFRNNVDDEESHAIDISESSDFSSFSESSHLDTIT